MFGIQHWNPAQGWTDYWRVPKDEDEAKSMLAALRHLDPHLAWRAFRVLDL